jgi:hypothetical protein
MDCFVPANDALSVFRTTRTVIARHEAIHKAIATELLVPANDGKKHQKNAKKNRDAARNVSTL